MKKAIEKAKLLIEALPYIKEFHNQIVVIKYGGSAMINMQLQKAVAQDIALLKYVGIKPVIVHGGGKEISNWLNKLGKDTEFVDGLRVTDKETMEITEMVLLGKVKKSLMFLINQFGCQCVGISGKDANFIVAEQKSEKLGYVGNITDINTDLLYALLDKNYIPVISPVGIGHTGDSFNINADLAASAIAIALNATKLILLTDVIGVLDSKNELVQKIKTSQIDAMIKDKSISGGMIPKLQCAKSAVENNVQSAHIIDGRVEHSILLEIFTNQGIGSLIYQ